jgi:hypothetical protein
MGGRPDHHVARINNLEGLIMDESDCNMDQIFKDFYTMKDQLALKSTELEDIQQKIDFLRTQLQSD